MYSGNAGLAHRFDEVLGAMRALKEHPELFFLFIGSGPRKKEIVEFAEAHGIENFRYLDYLPREQLRYSLSAASVHLLTLRSDMAGIAVPGKLYGIMAAGRPVVMVGPEASEPAQTILQEEVGFVIDPDERPEAATDRLVDSLLRLADDERLRERAGRLELAGPSCASYEQEVACAYVGADVRTHRCCTRPLPSSRDGNSVETRGGVYLREACFHVLKRSDAPAFQRMRGVHRASYDLERLQTRYRERPQGMWQSPIRSSMEEISCADLRGCFVAMLIAMTTGRGSVRDS